MLTDTERQALLFLSDPPAGYTATEVGEALWGRQHRMRQHFARPAGRVLHHLKARGLAVDSWVLSLGGGRREWRVTPEGHLVLRGVAR